MVPKPRYMAGDMDSLASTAGEFISCHQSVNLHNELATFSDKQFGDDLANC